MAKTKQTEFQHISPNFGYAYDVQQVLEHVLLHEVNSKTKYSVIQEDQNFGSGVWSIEDFNVLWEESDKVAGERIAFDGVPFFILHQKTLGCQFGMRKHSLKDNELSGQPKKRSCPATITMKEVIRFPDYKMQNETPYEKKKWTKVLNQDAANGIARSERRIYVETPPVNAHVHSIVVKASSGIPETNIAVPLCLICNAKLSTSTRSAIALFSGETRTSHRQLEVRKVVGSILSQELEEETAHSSIICGRCFNLIDDIDSLEEQLENKKQIVVDRYKRTVSLVTGNAQAEIPHPSEDDFLETYGKRGRGRGRGKSVGRGRGRGPGRPRGRPKGSGSKSVENHCTIKVENDSGKEDEEVGGSSATFFASLKSPPSLKTIKREDIMGRHHRPANAPIVVKMEPDTNGIIINEQDDDDDDDLADAVEPRGASFAEGLSSDGETMEITEELLELQKGISIKSEEDMGDKEIFKCSVCYKEFVNRSALRGHFKVHNKPDAYKCDECGEAFKSKFRLKKHRIGHGFHHEIHGCSVCQTVFNSTKELRAHMKSHKQGKGYPCKICGQVLTTPQTLELHGYTHTGERPFQCEICGATFRQRSNLQFHIKGTHNKEKNFHCHLCPKSFVRKRLLMYHHNSVHTLERPYKCEMCNSTFVYPHHYKRHLKRHAGLKPHKCPLCDKTFLSSGNRNAHMFLHTNRKPYECNICGQGFMRKKVCIIHLAHHGKRENVKSYITFNSPSMLAKSEPQEILSDDVVSVDTIKLVESIQSAEEEDANPLEDSIHMIEEPVEFLHDGKMVKVVSRKDIQVFEADENTRYVIHTVGKSENMDHYFSSFEGQVIEVQSEDIAH